MSQLTVADFMTCESADNKTVLLVSDACQPHYMYTVHREWVNKVRNTVSVPSVSDTKKEKYIL